MGAVSKQDWDRFLNQARVKLPGATDAGIKGELFDALSEFFNVSSAWMEDIEIDVSTDEQVYGVLPDGGQVIRLAGVLDADSIRVPAIMPTIGEIVFAGPFSQDQTVTVTVIKNVVLPTGRHSLPIVPDWVIGVYGTTILDGLLGRMMLQIAKSYSNETTGTYHLKKFNSGINSARVATMRRNTFGTQAWGFPQAFRTSGARGGTSTGNPGRF